MPGTVVPPAFEGMEVGGGTAAPPQRTGSCRPAEGLRERATPLQSAFSSRAPQGRHLLWGEAGGRERGGSVNGQG